MQEYLNINDELIDKVEWTPLKKGGRADKTHRLIKVSDDRMEYRLSASKTFNHLFMVLFGIGIILFSLFGDGMEFGQSKSMVILISGVIVTLVSFLIFIIVSKKTNLDKNHLAMWKGNLEPSLTKDATTLKEFHSLEGLHAIQVIKEKASAPGSLNQQGNGFSSNRSFYSYEINLVFKNTERVNLVDFEDIKSIKKQASILAGFFNIPLWSIIKEEDV